MAFPSGTTAVSLGWPRRIETLRHYPPLTKSQPGNSERVVGQRVEVLDLIYKYSLARGGDAEKIGNRRLRTGFSLVKLYPEFQKVEASRSCLAVRSLVTPVRAELTEVSWSLLSSWKSPEAGLLPAEMIEVEERVGIEPIPVGS
jgi:hypothetical protein